MQSGHVQRQDKLLRDIARWNEIHPDDPWLPVRPDAFSDPLEDDPFADEEPVTLESLRSFRGAL